MDAGQLKESDLEGSDQIEEDDVIEFASDAYSDVVLGDMPVDSFAAEGTVMHTIRQMCLTFETDPLDYEGVTISADGHTFTLTSDMLDRLTAGIDWIRSKVFRPDVEIRVDLSAWIPAFGTCDTAFYVDETLYISDYKNGVGKPVSAEENRQLMLYALAYWVLIGRPSLKRVVLNIDQPRAGGMKFWECSGETLLRFGEEVTATHRRIQAGNIEFVPSKNGCQFCPVKKVEGGCAAYNQWMVGMMGNALMDPSVKSPSFKDPSQISRAQRWYIIQHGSAIKSWLTKLYADSLSSAINGDPDPGSKAIMGSEGNRQFNDEDTAKILLVEALGEAAFKPRKIIGFTEIDALVKPGRKKQGHPETWEALQELVRRPPGKPKLVPVTHPSPALVQDWDDAFDDL
jgi:hypothetical protein